MSLAVLAAYAIGLGLGLVAARVAWFGAVWPTLVRLQILAAAIALSIVSVWRIDSLDSVLWPLLMAAVFAAMTGLAWLTVGPAGPPVRPDVSPRTARAARAAIQTWATNSNTAFFVIPVGTALAGSAGAVAAVLMDRLATPLYSTWIAVLRRAAPRPQRRRSSVVDQAPLLALVVGLALRLTGPAPAWTANVTFWAAPLLAASGAAVFVGSALHPSQRIDPRPGVRRWATLVGLRVALFTPLVLLAPTSALVVVGVLAALSIPAFGATQMSTVYGYADPVVAAGNRYGWAVGAVGLAAAALLAR